MDKVSNRLANSTMLLIAARLSMAVGAPITVAMLTWAITTLHSLSVKVETFPQQIVALQGQIADHARRIERLEQPFFQPRPPAPAAP